MSTPRAEADRGPADSHMMERFSTTYSASYRPFDESLKNVPVRCVPSSKSSSVWDNSGPSFAPLVTRERRCDITAFNDSLSPVSSSIVNTSPISNYRPSFIRVLNNTARSDCVGGRRMRETTEPIKSEDPLANSPSLCVAVTAPNRSCALIQNDAISTSPFYVCSGNKNYTSTYTTTVAAEKLSPCYSISRETNCDKAVQAVSSKSSNLYCTSQPRTAVNCDSVGPKKNSFTADQNDTSTLVSVHQPTYQFDFGQMFSQIARINSHLYLSSLNALTADRLRQHGITLLVSATIDAPPLQLRNAVTNSLHIAVEDMEGANIKAHFDRVADRIASEHRRGGRALVHCMAGVSRSSSLVLAYLLRHMNMSLADAYKHVRAVRPCIQPNPGFWRQLLEYEERLRGTRSVRLLPAVGYSGSCTNNPTGRLYSKERSMPRTSYMDWYSRPAGDLLPYRPLTSLHSIDSGKPYISCRQPLG